MIDNPTELTKKKILARQRIKRQEDEAKSFECSYSLKDIMSRVPQNSSKVSYTNKSVANVLLSTKFVLNTVGKTKNTDHKQSKKAFH